MLRDNRPDEVLIAIPSAPGERAPADRRGVPRAENVPVKTLPGLHELIAGDLNLGRPDPAGAGRGRARPRAGRGRPRARSPTYVKRQDGARHRRRRLDRLRALPPARAARRRAARARRQGRVGALRDRARARRRARLHRRDPRARRLRRPAEDAPGLRALPADRSSSTPRRTSTWRCSRRTRCRRSRTTCSRRARSPRSPSSSASSASCSSRPTRRRTRRTCSGQSKAVCEWIVESFALHATTSRRASSRCASATCSARRAR